jgi:hypothetical protein
MLKKLFIVTLAGTFMYAAVDLLRRLPEEETSKRYSPGEVIAQSRRYAVALVTPHAYRMEHFAGGEVRILEKDFWDIDLKEGDSVMITAEKLS